MIWPFNTNLFIILNLAILSTLYISAHYLIFPPLYLNSFKYTHTLPKSTSKIFRKQVFEFELHWLLTNPSNLLLDQKQLVFS